MLGEESSDGIDPSPRGLVWGDRLRGTAEKYPNKGRLRSDKATAFLPKQDRLDGDEQQGVQTQISDDPLQTDFDNSTQHIPIRP